jgi:hypothetical protein
VKLKYEQAGTISQHVSEIERKGNRIRPQKERFERVLLRVSYQIAASEDSLKEYRG